MARVLSANKSTSIAQNPQIAQAAPCIWTALSSKRRRNQSKVILRLWKLFNPFTLAAVLTKVTIALLPVVGTHGCVALIEKCKVTRSVHVNSGLVDSFECQHIKEAKNSSDCSPIATLYPDLVNYPCSDVVCSELSQIVSSLPSAVCDPSLRPVFRRFWFSFSQ